MHLQYGARVPCLETATLVFPIDGACHRPAPDATAFAHRDARFATALGASFPDPADAPANIAWTRAYDAALKPFSQDGGYINFMSGDDPGAARAELPPQPATARRGQEARRPRQPLPLQPQHRALTAQVHANRHTALTAEVRPPLPAAVPLMPGTELLAAGAVEAGQAPGIWAFRWANRCGRRLARSRRGRTTPPV